MKKQLMMVLVGLIGVSSVFAFTALVDDLDSGKGGWIRRGSTNNGGGVDWSGGYPVITLNTNNAQPHAIYHNIGSISLADGDVLRVMFDVKKAHTNAASGSLKVGLGYADAEFSDADQASVPVDGYVMRIPSGGSAADPSVDWVDKDVLGDGSTVNFFNKNDNSLGLMALEDSVSIGTNFTAVVFQVARQDTNLIFSGSVGDNAFSNTVSTTHATNTLANYEFNVVGLAFAYENELGQSAAYDNVRVELNPDEEVVEIYTTAFDGASQPGGADNPINMAGTLNGVDVSTLDPGLGADTGYALRAVDVSAAADMYATNYAGVTAINLGDGAAPQEATNLTSAIANDSYFEFTVDGRIAYDTLNFKLVKYGFAQLAGVTVRSSLDGFAADLVTFTDDVIQGAYAVAADLSSVPSLGNVSSVTFRFYLYNQYDGTQGNRKIGIDDIRLTGIPFAKTLFSTDFEDAVQSGGVGAPIDMNGTVHSNATVSALTNGAGTVNFALGSETTSDGLFAREVAGTNPSTDLPSAIANNEYYEFTLSSSVSVDLERFNFSLVKHGFVPLAGATLRSSLDGYTADLVTVTNDTSAGVYPASADLRSNTDFDNYTSATFRIYLYDEYAGATNRRIGIDNVQVTGIFADTVNPAELTIALGSGAVTIGAANLSETADYQLQMKTDLSLGSWSNVGAPVTGVTATNWSVSISDAAAFYQVEGSN